jgi:hypothetical protein
VYNNLGTVNTIYNHEDIYMYTYSARNYKSLTDYLIINENTSNLLLEGRVYGGSEIYTDHFLVQAKLRILPKLLHSCKKSKAPNHI